MSAQPDLASVATLLSEPTRVAMLDALMGGVALPASELARRAHVTPQTASEHLAKLVSGGLLRAQKFGRHRYFSLVGVDVARALEALALIAPPTRARSLSDSLDKRDFCAARTCYDHLAGRLGVAVTGALVTKRLLEEQPYQYAITPKGERWLVAFGLDLSASEHTRRKFAPKCLDWSERVPHIGGWLGAAIATHMLAAKWLRRSTTSRAVRLTELGQTALAKQLEIQI